MSSNYLLDLKISGDDLKYVDSIIKYLSSNKSTREYMLKYSSIVEKELFQNEYYIINFYMEFMNSIKDLGKIDLTSMKRLISLDKEMFVENPHIGKDFGISVNEDRAGMIEQMVVEKLDEIEALPEVAEEEFELSVAMLKEIIKDLKVQNLIYTSSIIFFEGKKIGREMYKGRDGYLKFMQKGILDVTNLDGESPVVATVTKEYILSSHSSNKPLFKHPLTTTQSSWGDVSEGDCISILAYQNVGKTTVTMNYIAESLMAGVNTAVFISEMAFTKVVSRIISVIGARKYSIRIPTGIILRYFSIDEKRIRGEKITKGDASFLSTNEQYINNIEFILNALQSEGNKELGTLKHKPDLILENMPTEFEVLKKEHNIGFFAIDHVNGVTSRYAANDVERINNAYKSANTLGKKFGIATLITNHIPEKQKEGILDKNADKSGLRGSRGSESVNSPDYVIILDANMEQKSRGEFVVSTNKDRNSNTFFEDFLGKIHVDVGMIYEVELE